MVNRRRSLLILFILAILGIVGFSQTENTKFYSLTVEDGLADRYTREIIRDTFGLLWIGTDEGVNVYNGNDFQLIDIGSLINDLNKKIGIHKMFRSSDGDIWITTNKGLFKYNYTSCNFNVYRNDNNDISSLPNDYCWEILEENGNLWISSFDALCLYAKEKDGFERFYLVENNDTLHHLTSLGLLNNNSLLVGTYKDGIYSFDLINKKFSPFFLECKDSIRGLSHILLDDHEKIWIGGSGGLIVFDRTNDSFEYYNGKSIKSPVKNDIVNDIYQDKKGNIWIAYMAEGIAKYDNATGKFTVYKEDSDVPHTLARNSITSIYQDEQDIMWFTTNQGGICYSHQVFNYFQAFNHLPGNPNSLINNQVKTFTEDGEGKIWIGTENGISVFNKENKKFHHFVYEQNNKNSLTHNKINSLSCTNDNLVWAGARYGLNVIDKSTSKVYQVPIKLNGEIYDRIPWVNQIKKDSKNNLWVKIDNRTLIYIENNGNVPSLINPAKVIDTQSFCIEFHIDGEDNLWCLFSYGLVYYNLNTQKKTIYEDPQKDINNHFNNFEVDSSGTFWLVPKKGLSSFNPISKNWKTYDLSLDKLGKEINSIEIDFSGKLWLGTTFGLHRFDPVNNEIVSYYKEDGIAGNYFVHNGSFLTSKGELLMAGLNGFTLFDPGEISISDYEPRVNITEITNYNQRVLPGSEELDMNMNISKKLVLKHDHSVKIWFASTNLIFPNKTKYAYKIPGMHDEWEILKGQNQISLIKIEPGSYDLFIKTTNKDGVWSSKISNYKIIVEPPFWNTMWFRISLVLLLFAAVVIIFYFRTNAIREKNIQLEKMVELRTQEINEANEELKNIIATKNKFFSIIAHDLRNPFQSITGFASVLLSRLDELNVEKTKEMVSFIKKSSFAASSLLENLLTWSRVQTGKLDFKPEVFHLIELVNQILMVVDVSAKKKDIQIRVDIDLGLLVFADKNMINTVIRNLVSNSIKFTEDGGVLQISATVEGDMVIVRIKDNGVGMNENIMNKLFKIDESVSTSGTKGEGGTGLGLILCKEFVEEHGGKIWVESQKGIGSVFSFSIPFSNEISETLQSKERSIEKEQSYYEEVMSIEDVVLSSYDYTTEKSQTILLVEDNPEIRDNITETLGQFFNLIQAENGKQGWHKILETRPDLIVSDIMMPVMDGIELCNKVKSTPESSHIPVILLTAKDKTEDKIEGLESGADDYITKPFEPSLLVARVKNLIMNRQKLFERFSTDLAVAPEDLTLSDSDKHFINNAVGIIEKHIGEEDFNVDYLVNELDISRTLVYSKIKSYTGTSVNEFIMTIRVKKAAAYIKETNLNLAEIAYKVGFKDPSHFTKAFKKQFGMAPSQFKL